MVGGASSPGFGHITHSTSINHHKKNNQYFSGTSNQQL